MILLVDADSLVFASNYKKRETPDDSMFYDNLEDCIVKFDEQFMRIVNTLEDQYNIDKVITFNGSRGNFRNIITGAYKANRDYSNLPPFLREMHEYVKKEYNSIVGWGVETDDMVARYWHKITKEHGRNEAMIVSIDKDYKQLPCLMYNYHFKHRVVYDISEEEALFNFYAQCIAGDAADNVNYFKGKGIKFAEKYYKDCVTEYQYRKKLLQLFKDKYKGKARQKYAECYHLLKLRTE